MEFIVGYPKGSPLVSDYLANKDQVADFFGRSFLSVGDFQSKAMEVDGRFGRAERELAAQAVLVPPGADEARLELRYAGVRVLVDALVREHGVHDAVDHDDIQQSTVGLMRGEHRLTDCPRPCGTCRQRYGRWARSVRRR